MQPQNDQSEALLSNFIITQAPFLQSSTLTQYNIWYLSNGGKNVKVRRTRYPSCLSRFLRWRLSRLEFPLTVIQQHFQLNLKEQKQAET